jgi:hypothetical protein
MSFSNDMSIRSRMGLRGVRSGKVGSGGAALSLTKPRSFNTDVQRCQEMSTDVQRYSEMSRDDVLRCSEFFRRILKLRIENASLFVCSGASKPRLVFA